MEYTKPRGNPNINYRIWVINSSTCQCNECKFISFNKFLKRAMQLILKEGQYKGHTERFTPIQSTFLIGQC